MPFVMLKKNWPGNFRRCIRDAAGKILETVVFTPGEPVDFPLEHWPVIEKDIGPTLMLGELINGRFVVRDPKDFTLIKPADAPKLAPDTLIDIQTQPGESFEDSLLRKVLTEDPALQPEADKPETVPEPEQARETVSAPDLEAELEPETEVTEAETPAADEVAEEPAPKGKHRSAKALLGKDKE